MKERRARTRARDGENFVMRPSTFASLLAGIAFACALGGCSKSGGDANAVSASSDPALVQQLAASAKAPVPVACHVSNDLAHHASAAIEATFHNTAHKEIVGADLTVVDGMATSTYVPLAIAAGQTFVMRRALALANAPSPHATCTLTLLQFAR